MKKLIILTILIVLTGCKSFPVVPINFNIENDSHKAIAFNLALSFLEMKGYPVGKNVKQPLVVMHSSPRMMQQTLGLSQPFKAWYCPETRTIHLTKGCGLKEMKHEFMHFILQALGIPINLHHEIMGIRP